MTEQVRSVVLGTAGLSVAAIVALWLTLARSLRADTLANLSQLRRTASVAIAVHVVHFLEEWHTAFYVRFPELLGLAAWPVALFVAFNAVWIAMWILGVALLARLVRALWFPVWFLAIASVANGVAHPLLAAAAGGYFPGLWSSPVAGLAGIALLRALVGATRQNPRAAIEREAACPPRT